MRSAPLGRNCRPISLLCHTQVGPLPSVADYQAWIDANMSPSIYSGAKARGFTASEYRATVRMKRDGASFSEIGRTLNRPFCTIKNNYNKLPEELR